MSRTKAVQGRFARAIAVAAALASSAAAAAETPKIIVLDFQVAGDMDRALGPALAEAATLAVAKLGFYAPISSAELRTVLGIERQRQLAGGCSDDSECLTEIAGAFGAPFAMNGSVARFGEAFQLTIQVLNAKTAQPIGRSVRLARNLALLRALVPYAVSEATGAPPPPAPSRLLPYSLMGAGAASVVAGGLFGALGLQEQAQLNRELSQATNLGTLPSYRERASAVGAQKTAALLLLAAGAGLIAGGVFLNPADLATSGGVALFVGPASVGFAGTWD